MFKKVLLLMSLLFIGNFSFASECIEEGDLTDDRLIEYSCELSENETLLKEFVVYGYSESFLGDGRSNRLTVNLIELEDKVLRVVGGNVVDARLYNSTPENKNTVNEYCNDVDNVLKTPNFDYSTEIKAEKYMTSVLFKKTDISWSELNLSCNN